MRTPSRRLQVLFTASLLGVLVIVGLAVGRFLGWIAAALYVVLVLAGIGLAAQRAGQQARRAAGRSCSCCTTSQHDPVKVI